MVVKGTLAIALSMAVVGGLSGCVANDSHASSPRPSADRTGSSVSGTPHSQLGDGGTLGQGKSERDRPIDKGLAAVVDVGVTEDNEAPFSTHDFLATGHWGGRIAGQTVVVYVGQAGSHSPSTGEVRIQRFDPRGPGIFKEFPAVGALRIVSVKGGVLTAHTQAGNELTVNLRTLLR